MGNSLPFWKDKAAVNEDPSSVKAVASVPPHAAGAIATPSLDQGPHSPTTITSRPVNVASVGELKELSYQEEMKTLEAADLHQELCVEAELPVVPVIEQASISPTTVVVVEDSSGARHSTRTGADGSGGASKIGHSTRTEGDDGSGETGQSTKIKKKRRTTHKRQHGESTN